MGQFTLNKSRRSLWKRKLFQNRLYKYIYNLLKISNIPYNLIFTTKCNDYFMWLCEFVVGEWIRSFICLYYCCRFNYQDGYGRDLINQFNPVTLLCLSQARTWITSYVVVFLVWSVSSFKMGDDCLLCWYWGNCWASLLKIH